MYVFSNNKIVIIRLQLRVATFCFIIKLFFKKIKNILKELSMSYFSYIKIDIIRLQLGVVNKFFERLLK